MSARDMSRRGTVGGGRARFQPRARGANRSFRGRGSAFLSVSSCFSSRKPAFDWELLPLLLRFVRGARGKVTDLDYAAPFGTFCSTMMGRRSKELRLHGT